VLREILSLKQWRYPFPLTEPRREAAAAIARREGSAAGRFATALAHSRDGDVAEAARAALRAQSEEKGHNE
jgi:hypothetical protein